MAYNISYIYQIIDKFSPALKKIHSATTRFQGGMKKTASMMDTAGKKLGSLQTMALGAATAIGGKAALDKFVSFDSAMNNLEAVTLAGSEQMKAMRDTAKQLGATTQFTAGEAAQGMQYLAMAGLDTEQVMKAIPGALQLAAAGGLELGQAADIATNVMGQFGMQVEDLTRINNVLAAAQSKANFNISELFEAMRPIGTTASNLGVSLEELSAYLGTMANAGEKGSIAGTLLRNAMTEVSTASEKQRNIYKNLGIDFSKYTDKVGKLKDFKGLVGELGRLQKAGKLSVGALQELYGERGFRAMQILAKAGADSIGELQEKITGTDAASRAAEIKMKGLPGALKAMSSAFESVIIAIFESGLGELLTDLSNKITVFARKLSESNPQLLKIGGLIALVTAVAAPFLAMLGMMMPFLAAIPAAIGAISAPMVVFGAAFVAVGAAIYQIWKNWDYLVQDFKESFGFIKQFFGAFITDQIASGIKLLKGDFSGFIEDIKKAFGLITTIKSKLGFGPKGETADEKVARVRAMRKAWREAEGVAAKNSTANATLNGNITVSAADGAAVNSATMQTSVPGNLGFNIAGAGG